MKFGVREICDVVLKAKATQVIGNKKFYKNEPVIYFDTLKTSSMEGAATTVYAQGGRGNTQLMAWEGERTVTFTMEDALISPEGFMILSGAGLIEATEDGTIKQHVTQTVARKDTNYAADSSALDIPVNYKPFVDEKSDEDYIYVFLMREGEIMTEPYIGKAVHQYEKETGDDTKEWTDVETATLIPEGAATRYVVRIDADNPARANYNPADLKDDMTEGSVAKFDAALIDYYVERSSGAKQIEITADSFGGNYYLEASTLFRNQAGVDMPAEFVIPNCKVQSNFNFTMASSGDPSTFTFTLDAFPDYTRFDPTKKVLAAIQIIEEADETEAEIRLKTWANS